jgi:hypothetical protein
MLANGLAMPPFPPPSWAPFEFAAKGLSLGKETLPSPALCNAILVPMLFKKPMVLLLSIDKAGLVEEGDSLCLGTRSWCHVGWIEEARDEAS